MRFQPIGIISQQNGALDHAFQFTHVTGEVITLQRLLNRRFGPLSADVTRRLSQSTPEQLEIWAERVLDARAIDEVFAEN